MGSLWIVDIYSIYLSVSCFFTFRSLHVLTFAFIVDLYYGHILLSYFIITDLSFVDHNIIRAFAKPAR